MDKFANWLLALAIILVGALTIFPALPRAIIKFVLSLMMMVGLYGCASPAVAAEVTDSFAYGRFTVEVLSDGTQVVVGGVHTPDATPPVSLMARHSILVDFSAKSLWYYRGGAPMLGYAVTTPNARDLPQAVVRGRVKVIEQNPWWCPTPNGRKKYPDLPPGCLPPLHELNAMGVAKFIIDWDVPRHLRDDWETIRLHGTPGYSPGPFWEDDTLGCARLTNDEMHKLLEELGPAAVKEGIEVVFLRGRSTEFLLPNGPEFSGN